MAALALIDDPTDDVQAPTAGPLSATQVVKATKKRPAKRPASGMLSYIPCKVMPFSGPISYSFT